MNQAQKKPINLTPSVTTSIMEYINLFWQWAWLIVLAGILAGGAAYFVSNSQTPIYQTTTRLLVGEPPGMRSIDPYVVVSNQTTLRTYSAMLTDTPVMQRVIARLGLENEMTPERLKGSISVQNVTDTLLIAVTVISPSPLQAYNIADSIGTEFSAYIREKQATRYESSIQNLEKQVADTAKQIEQITSDQANNTDTAVKQRLDAELAQAKSTYTNLLTNLAQIRLSQDQNTTIVITSEPPKMPVRPVSPNVPQNTILGLIIGILLSAGAVFLYDLIDDTIKNPEEVRLRFNVPVLGVISRHSAPEGRPVSQDQPRSPVAESFRGVRTNITFAGVDTPLRRIIVTSATPMDGKTTICSNLAVVFAQNENRVVLIDADLRRPQVHARLGMSNRIGLSDAILHPLADLENVLQASSVAGLKVITSGAIPPNPAELLGSRKMLQILDKLNAENDLVLIDTPPILSVTDAAALAPSVDGVIVVAKPGQTKLAALQQTLEQLQSVGANVLGVVLNDIIPNSRRYGYYYRRYYSKYSHYYDTPEENGTRPGKKSKVAPSEK